MTLTLPLEGIDEVRRLWVGRGTIWNATAAVADEHDIQWSPQLARRRAARVVFELARPPLSTWPDSVRKWIDALPAQSYRERMLADAPRSGVQWAETRRLGWPPKAFVVKHRQRVAETLLLITLRWTIEKLHEVRLEAERVLSDIAVDLSAQLEAAVQLLEVEPVRSAHPVLPSSSDLAIMRVAGRPWRSVANVAKLLRLLDHDQDELANRLIDPDPAMADRLFHVAIFGLTLQTLRAEGWTLRPVGLFGGGSGGPILLGTSPLGESWDIWFEAAGAWNHYTCQEPFPGAMVGISGTGGPLGADIALIRGHERAVLIECKFSANPTYVGRGGYEQTLAYMAEAVTALTSEATGILVGPKEVVMAHGSASTAMGTVHVIDPGALAHLLPSLLGEA